MQVDARANRKASILEQAVGCVVKQDSVKTEYMAGPCMVNVWICGKVVTQIVSDHVYNVKSSKQLS